MKFTAVLLLIGLQLLCYAGEPSSHPPSSERQLDQRVVELLAEESELVVVGELTRLNLANSRYGVVLHKAELPFEIKTLKVLKGDGVEGKVLKVGVTHDEAFLYDEGDRYLFFLKTDPEKGKFTPEPLAQREWRVVADHFGVQRHTTALEKMVSALDAKLLSCQNHRAHLVFSLRTAYQQQHAGKLPYEPGVPGYLMLARYGATQQPGGVNCNHGAPERCIGGWQAVNLSPPKWLALHRAWTMRFGDTEIPFFWCGRSTGLGRRVVVSVRWASLSEGEGWSFEYTVVPEQQLSHLIKRLGECLATIDAEPIDIDVPGNVDWRQFTAPTSALSGPSAPQTRPRTSFGIYLTVEPMDVTSPGSPRITDLSRVALEDTPIIAEPDVEYYDSTNGVIMVKEDSLRRIRGLFEDHDAGTQQPGYRPPVAGRTFVVVVGEERVFLGALWSLYSSHGGASVPTLPIDAPSVIRARYSSPAWSDPRIAASLRQLNQQEP